MAWKVTQQQLQHLLRASSQILHDLELDVKWQEVGSGRVDAIQHSHSAILHVAPEAIMIGVRSLFEMSGGWWAKTCTQQVLH